MGSAESSQTHNFVEDALSNFALAQLGQRQIAAISKNKVTMLVS